MGWVVRLRGWKVRDGRRGWGGCGGSGSLKGLDEGAQPVEGLWDEVRPWELSPGSTWLCLSSGGEAPNLHPPGEHNFIKSLIHFDKDNISDKVLKKIGAYCAQPDFQPDIIGRVSLAAKSLCMWVRAMEVGGDRRGGSSEAGWEEGDGRLKADEWVASERVPAVSPQLYGRLYRVVEPKRIRMNAALAQLQEKQAALAEAQEKLREVSLVPMFSVFRGGSSPRF